MAKIHIQNRAGFKFTLGSLGETEIPAGTDHTLSGELSPGEVRQLLAWRPVGVSVTVDGRPLGDTSAPPPPPAPEAPSAPAAPPPAPEAPPGAPGAPPKPGKTPKAPKTPEAPPAPPAPGAPPAPPAPDA